MIDRSGATGHTHEELLAESGQMGLLMQPVRRQLLQEPYPYLHTLLAAIIAWMDLAGVALGSGFAHFLECSGLTRQMAEAMGAADLVAVLVFLLFPKKRTLLAFPKVRRLKAQCRYLVPPVLAAACAHVLLCAVLEMPVIQSVRLTGIWLLAVMVPLLIARGGLTFFLYQPSVIAGLRRKIAIVGEGDLASELAERISHDAGHTYGLFGVFPDSEASADDAVKGSLQALVQRSRHESLHAIILAFPEATVQEDVVRRTCFALRSVACDIYVTPNMVTGIDQALPQEFLGPNTLLVLQRRPLTETQNFEKRVLDIVLGIFALIFLSPFLILVALLIRLDSRGPVFFRQPRIGKNGREFLVYKFRSMYANQADLGAAKQTSRDDPRVTRVGKWLRKLSIDEIPQLFNVLKGEMSLVGPRPHAPQTRAGGLLLDDALAEYVLRYHVKPGITGWAQINGARGELVTLEDLEKRVNLDLEYIRRWSILFDLKIMILTVVREVFSRHAF
ncbi:exopolysaccharide biosynthesis polyprenyl glycosylphosphotransferase [Acetobacter estunensis]|uniref:exopolysaccharide biosynthesis polyprenyl glycosylphosphotransferase n=1 Tax=Acetobacter estunensis TaxID=104097 RepID=UPI0020C4CA53|nr:exopolysaccharide biosynthesis polyprenyl glycosylphosphotransferase [Acetobacter estunensis]